MHYTVERKGDGNGPMIQSGAYGDLGVVPAYKSLDTLSEGKIFHSIYYGKGYMGMHMVRSWNKKKYGHLSTMSVNSKLMIMEKKKKLLKMIQLI